MKRGKLAAAAAAMFAGAAMATPLRMDYCVEDQGGGIFRYTFRLTLDNNDNSWAAGQGFGWFIFGDQQSAPTPLTGFVGDNSSLPAGPFTQFQTSSGFHNGPTLGPVVQGPPNFPPNLWIPSAVGESIGWAGTATVDLVQGRMLWSNLMAGGGSASGNFVEATRLSTCGGAPTCYPDCDLSHSLNVNDFVCFQQAFAGGNMALADCTRDNTLNVNDFVCFQSAFAAGCSAP